MIERDDSDSASESSDAVVRRSRKKKSKSFSGFLKELKYAVKHREFLDVTKLDRESLQAMKMSDSSLVLMPGSVVYDVYDPVATPQGFLEYVQLCSESASYTNAEVADMIRWYSRVDFTRGTSALRWTTFMKRFMVEHMSRIGSWVQEFERDLGLRDEFLLGKSPYFSDHAGPNVGGGRGGGKGSNGARGGGKSGRKGKGVGHGVPSKKFCFGYCDPLKRYRVVPTSACMFVHTCASCGPSVSHTAEACQADRSWDQVKVAVVMRACGM